MPFLSNWPLLKRLALAPFRRSLTPILVEEVFQSNALDILCASKQIPKQATPSRRPRPLRFEFLETGVGGGEATFSRHDRP